MTCVLSERSIAPARPQWGKYSVFRRAGAKNVSRHPTTPHAGAVFLSPQLHPCPTGGTKFTLLGSISVQAVQNSPSTHKTRQKGPFRASRASFVPEVAPRSSSRANYVPAAARRGPWWRVLPHLDTAHVTSCRSPPTHAHRSQAVQSLRRSPHRHRWGFRTIRSPLAACHRRVVLLMVQFPPIGGGEAATHSGVVPTVQTTSAKSADNGLSWARWSTFWAQACLARRVVRTRTPEHAREPLETHVNPSTCAWAEPPTRITATGTLIWGSAAPSVAKLTAW